MKNKLLLFSLIFFFSYTSFAAIQNCCVRGDDTIYILRGNDICKINKGNYSMINQQVSHTKVDVDQQKISAWVFDDKYTITNVLSDKDVARLAEYLHVDLDYKSIADKIVYPNKIYFGSEGVIYALCRDNAYIPGIVALIDPNDGHTIKVYKLGSEAERKKMYLTDIAVNNAGEIYVADYANSLVYHLNNKGGIVNKWGGRGGGDGQFKQVWGIAIDPGTNDVYVSDIFPGSERKLWEYPQRRIQVFDRDGKFKRKWGKNEILGVNWWPLRWNVRSDLGDVVDIAINKQGEVYLLEKNRNKVAKYTNEGRLLMQWGSYGANSGQFNSPESICIDDSGNIYIADTGNNRVQKFDSNGRFLMEIK